MQTIFRMQKTEYFTTIHNTSLYDARLSWKAKALHIFMLSKPDDWVFYNEELTKWAKDGRSALDSGLAELKTYGYVKKERRRDKSGKFHWVTLVYEVPQMDAPQMEKPALENEQLLITHSPNTDTPNDEINVYQLYEQYGFGKLTSYIRQKLAHWCEALSAAHVRYAMERALAQNVVRWAYVDKILSNWHTQKLLTLDAVHEAEAAFRARKRTSRQKELVPEWLHAPQKSVDAAPTRPVIDFEEERRKVLAKLGADGH